MIELRLGEDVRILPEKRVHPERKEKKINIDVSRIPVNKGIRSRLRWTKYIDLYKIVLPSLNR